MIVAEAQALIRVGHKGADAIVAGNTLASFDAALAGGVDMIEFDVLAERPDGGGELYVVHDYGELRRHPRSRANGGAPTLAEALAHLASPPFAEVRLQVDLKRQGYEQRVVDALTASDVVERSFISTGRWRSLETLRAIAPQLRLGWTISDPLAISSTPLLSQTAGVVHRATLPRRTAGRIRSGAIDALVAQWQLITPALVAAVLGAGGEIYAWTVDDAAQIRRLAAIGVSGVITNDPRLFS
jgi:glycerophosphoryl diester phosphodiesterase